MVTQSTQEFQAHTTRGAPANLLRNRAFILLWAAYGISALGDHLSEMGLLKLQDALAVGRTDTVRRQAIMTFVFMFPFFVLGPFCGWVADRLPRKWIMIAADVIRAVLMFEIVPVLFWLFERFDPQHAAGAPLPLHIAVMPLAVVGVFAAFFSPARLALLPTLIRPDQLIRANAMTAGLGMLATIASAVLGGWLVEHVGVRWNFRIDALTFVGSAVLLAGIVASSTSATLRRTDSPGTASPDRTGDASGAHRGEHDWSALIEGFRYVRRHRRVAEVIVLMTVLWIAASVVRSIIPAVVKDVFGGSYGDIGIYQGLLGVGLLVGSVLLSLMGSALKSELAMSWSLKLAGVSGLLMTLAIWLGWGRGVAGTAIVLVGLFGAGIQVSANALLQRIVPDYIRGRVFGVSDLFSQGGLLLATGVLGIPEWPNIDRHISWIMAITAALLLGAGIWTTITRLQRGRFGRAITFWRNLNEFYCRLWPRARREGLCTIPAQGPVIVAANHHSSLDPFLLSATSPNRYVGFMIAREFAMIPGFRRLVDLIECVPVNRSGVDTASIKAALRHLEQGRVLGIFPQGRIQRRDEPVQLRDGVGLLALRSGATVIPAYISGTVASESVVWPFLRRHRAVVRYGPPVDLSRFAGRDLGREAYREASAAVLRAIFALAPPGSAFDFSAESADENKASSPGAQRE